VVYYCCCTCIVVFSFLYLKRMVELPLCFLKVKVVSLCLCSQLFFFLFEITHFRRAGRVRDGGSNPLRPRALR
jgi:hypothetical protein